MFRFAQVEAALIKLHDGAESSPAAFRARLKYFQRIGIVAESPGKGSRVVYRLEDVLTWAFCLELSEFGIDPKTIQAIYVWSSMAIGGGLFREESGDDVFFIVTPQIMGQAFDPKRLRYPISSDQVPDQMIVARASKIDFTAIGRGMVINLSSLRRRVLGQLEKAG